MIHFGHPVITSFLFCQNEEIARGFEAMAAERRKWLSKPAHLVRAARHYEGAAQILIRHAVMTARNVSRLNVKIFPATWYINKFFVD